MKYLVLLISFSLYGASVQKSFPAKGITNLKVKNAAGTVDISVSPDNKAHVTATKKNFDKRCKLIIKKEGSDLVAQLEKEGKGWFTFDKCNVDFKIQVPKKVALDLKNGVGDLILKGTQGKVDYKLGNGNVEIDAKVSELIGKVGVGNLKAKGLQGSADVKAGSGTVQLSFDKASQKSKVDIKLGVGNTTLYFPQNTKIKTSFKSGVGSLKNDFSDSAQANIRINHQAGSGNLSIKKL